MAYSGFRPLEAKNSISRRMPLCRRKVSLISRALRALIPLMRVKLSGSSESTSSVLAPKVFTSSAAVAGPTPLTTPEARYS